MNRLPSASDPRTTLRSYEVLNMVKPPTALFEPRILFAVLFKKQRSSTSHETTSSEVDRVLAHTASCVK